jgi:hypothetical protein
MIDDNQPPLGPDEPYRILSPSRVLLSPMAQEMAATQGMTNVQLARHLLEQHRQREAGLLQAEGCT